MVILRQDLRKTTGKRSCCSDVIHNRKLSCGFSALNSFVGGWQRGKRGGWVRVDGGRVVGRGVDV